MNALLYLPLKPRFVAYVYPKGYPDPTVHGLVA
jgi:hypothetical protein